jgi:hypothetical protein
MELEAWDGRRTTVMGRKEGFISRENSVEEPEVRKHEELEA